MTGDAEPAGRRGRLADAPTWARPREAVRVVCYGPHLWRTGLTALVVGTVLFAINQLDVVLAGRAGAGTWIKTGITFLVPFTVANIGLLLGRRRHR
ncbi:MAG: hypothetical protein EPN43_11840 [Jatrophihabitans sp.]|nr:MAG: hypothetical protein EPN43_11840 [Jatrophihabitans sp.]